MERKLLCGSLSQPPIVMQNSGFDKAVSLIDGDRITRKPKLAAGPICFGR
jgi:hypothetical protein